MLNDIIIEGFRGLDGLTIKETSKFNLLVGPNNSGKTSVLEALFLHCAPLNFHAWLTILSIRNGGFTPTGQYIFDQLKWYFAASQRETKNPQFSIIGKWNENKRVTKISVEDFGLDSETKAPQLPTSSPIQAVGISGTSGTSGTLVSEAAFRGLVREEKVGIKIGTFHFSFESDKEKKREQVLNFTNIGPLIIPGPKMRTDIPAVYSDPFAHRNPNAGIKEYDQSVKRDFDKKSLGIVQMLDSEIKHISILLSSENTPELYATHDTLGKTPISNLGDGIRRIYLISTALVQCSGGIFLIDELESSIHTTGLNKLINWLVQAASELNIQIFASTHSLECIDAILGCKYLQENELSLFKLGKKESKVSCKRISRDTLQTLRQNLGQDVRW